MWALSAATRIYLAAGPTDLRKGFDGLYGLMRDRLQICPQSGHLALFCNRDRTRLKLLYWDGTGLWLCTKRLERGRFSWPAATGEGRVVLSQEELALLLGGIELHQTRRKAWYGRPAEKVTRAA
jgi:transposase